MNLSLPFEPTDDTKAPVTLSPDAFHLRGFVRAEAKDLVEAVLRITTHARFRRMVTPGGWPMSVEMTNCGRVGWVTDEAGYRYDSHDPQSGSPWPDMPEIFSRMATGAASAAGFRGFAPDACLINRYVPGAKLSLHQDKNERDLGQPVVSMSLGLPAVFLWGGRKRADRTLGIALESGDVAVWGGAARLMYHGVKALADGHHPLTGACRLNLTFRRAL